MEKIEDFIHRKGFKTWYDGSAGEEVISLDDAKKAISEYIDLFYNYLQNIEDYGDKQPF